MTEGKLVCNHTMGQCQVLKRRYKAVQERARQANNGQPAQNNLASAEGDEYPSIDENLVIFESDESPRELKV